MTISGSFLREKRDQNAGKPVAAIKTLRKPSLQPGRDDKASDSGERAGQEHHADGDGDGRNADRERHARVRVHELHIKPGPANPD